MSLTAKTRAAPAGMLGLVHVPSVVPAATSCSVNVTVPATVSVFANYSIDWPLALALENTGPVRITPSLLRKAGSGLPTGQ